MSLVHSSMFLGLSQKEEALGIRCKDYFCNKVMDTRQHIGIEGHCNSDYNYTTWPHQ